MRLMTTIQLFGIGLSAVCFAGTDEVIVGSCQEF